MFSPSLQRLALASLESLVQPWHLLERQQTNHQMSTQRATNPHNEVSSLVCVRLFGVRSCVQIRPVQRRSGPEAAAVVGRRARRGKPGGAEGDRLRARPDTPGRPVVAHPSLELPGGAFFGACPPGRVFCLCLCARRWCFSVSPYTMLRSYRDVRVLGVPACGTVFVVMCACDVVPSTLYHEILRLVL